MEWTRWDAHPSVVLGLGLLAGAYLLGTGPVRRRYGWAERIAPARALAFFGGLAVLFVALTGPLHDLADHFLFSAHMVQHLLLTLVVPPLLLAGTPGWLLKPILTGRRARLIARALTRPVAAFAVYNSVLIAWHLPVLYEWAMRNHDAHIVQHLMFIGTGLLLWWPILSPLPELPRLSPPAQMLYLFLAGVPMVLVSALITLSDEVLYPFYAAAPRVSGLTALADQRLGGVIMWVPGSLVFLVAITAVFFAWASGESEGETTAAAPGRAGEEGFDGAR